MVAAFGPYLAGIVGGTVGSMIVGDTLKSVPVKQSGPGALDANAAPMSKAATPRTTGDGQVVPTGAQQSPRALLHLSAGYIVVALIILLCGARVFRNAKL